MRTTRSLYSPLYAVFTWLALCLVFFPFWSLPCEAKPKKKSQKKSKKPSKKRYTFSFLKIRLPKRNATRLFSSKTMRKMKIRRPQTPQQKGNRKRPPTIRLSAKEYRPLSLRSGVSITSKVPHLNKKKVRKHARVRSLHRSGRTYTRLVVYERKMGRRGWIKRWLGHILVYPKRKLKFKCPWKPYCKQLRDAERTVRSSVLRAMRRPSASFSWHLRRQLERQKGYEIIVQTK